MFLIHLRISHKMLMVTLLIAMLILIVLIVVIVNTFRVSPVEKPLDAIVIYHSESKYVVYLCLFHALHSFPPWPSTSPNWGGPVALDGEVVLDGAWLYCACPRAQGSGGLPSSLTLYASCWSSAVIPGGTAALPLFLSGLERQWYDNRHTWCCGAPVLCQALKEDITCVISLNLLSLVCRLKATSNHVRKVFPKAAQFYGTLEEKKMFPGFRFKLPRAINISVWYK